MDVPTPFDDDRPARRPVPTGVALATAAVLATYVGLVGLMYLVNAANRPAAPAADKGASPEQKLAELRAEDKARQEGYGYNDKAAGVVSLPVERAMELYAREGRLPLDRQPKPPAPATPAKSADMKK